MSLRSKENSLDARTSRLLIPLVKVARLAGFEPTTPWFVAKYSIQLSYSREAAHYSIKTGAVYKAAASR
jgi:hypothetical protein